MKVTHMALKMVVTAVAVLGGLASVVLAQEPDLTKPTVNLAQSIGCAEMKAGDPTTWWISRASAAAVTQQPFVSAKEIEEAKNVALGSATYQLLGFPEFLDREGLLKSTRRSEFTAPESVNSTGQLVNGAKVMVKGLYIEGANPQRINLTSVIKLADTCQ